MVTSTLVDPEEQIAQHLPVLREYAGRALLRGERIPPYQMSDLGQRMREVLAIGQAFKLTEREIVSLVYKGLFVSQRGCGCPSCRAREGT